LRKLSTTSCRRNWSPRKLDRFVNLFCHQVELVEFGRIFAV
jgi:hypothetical protein